MTAANRFRFRAWDVHENRMEYPVCFYTTGLMFQNWHNHPDRYSAFMQSTGLCDKNGKEIFEGDILRDRTGTGPGPVVWDSNIAAFSWSGGEDWGMIHCPEIEIIGNIYQNPDLLKS